MDKCPRGQLISRDLNTCLLTALQRPRRESSAGVRAAFSSSFHSAPASLKRLCPVTTKSQAAGTGNVIPLLINGYNHYRTKAEFRTMAPAFLFDPVSYPSLSNPTSYIANLFLLLAFAHLFCTPGLGLRVRATSQGRPSRSF